MNLMLRLNYGHQFSKLIHLFSSLSLHEHWNVTGANGDYSKTEIIPRVITIIHGSANKMSELSVSMLTNFLTGAEFSLPKYMRTVREKERHNVR